MAPVEFGIPNDPRVLRVTLRAGETHRIDLTEGRNHLNDKLLRRRIDITCRSDDQGSIVNHTLVEGDPKLKIVRLALGFKNEAILEQEETNLRKGQKITLFLRAPNDVVKPLAFFEIEHK